MNDNLNMILTDASGYLINDACELDRNEGNNKKHLKNMAYNCFKILDEISRPLYLDKITFQCFLCFVFMRH